jgi:Transposase IS200 like
MGRPRKRHVQTELPKVDKNGQFRGGRRRGAGRPKRGVRASEKHEVRPRISAYQPVHVVMRASSKIGSLRQRSIFRAILEASFAAFIHDEHAVTRPSRSAATAKVSRAFHIVHISIQRTHIHLIVEASDRHTLATGMQAFGISAAKHINATIRDGTGARRRGSVFTDRYHARILSTPTQVRNCIAYVLNNWRHHGDDRERLRNPWRVDPYSSALAFDGWKERGGEMYRVPRGYTGPMVWKPQTWLLRVGWRMRGLISVDEIPGRGDE